MPVSVPLPGTCVERAFLIDPPVSPQFIHLRPFSGEWAAKARSGLHLKATGEGDTYMLDRHMCYILSLGIGMLLRRILRSTYVLRGSV